MLNNDEWYRFLNDYIRDINIHIIDWSIKDNIGLPERSCLMVDKS